MNAPATKPSKALRNRRGASPRSRTKPIAFDISSVIGAVNPAPHACAHEMPKAFP